MTNGDQLTREEQTWLVEYEVCQKDNSSQSSTYWLIFSIFFGINSLTLGWLLKGLLDRSITPVGYTVIIINIISVVMIGILILLCLWLLRTNYLMGINRKRMLRIEGFLNMRAKRIVRALDNPNDNEDEAAQIFAEHYRPNRWFERSILQGHWIAFPLISILKLSWIGLIVILPVFNC